VHANPGAFAKAFVFGRDENSSDGLSGEASLILFGSHEASDPAHNPLSFMSTWTRIACRLASRIAEKAPHTKGEFDKVFPNLSIVKCDADLPAITRSMWRYRRGEGDKLEMEKLDLATGGVEPWTRTDENVPINTTLEDEDTLATLILPVCAHDHLIASYRAKGLLPVPCCSISLKWELVDRTAKQLNPELRKEYEQKFGTAETRWEMKPRPPSIGSAEQFLQTKLGTATWQDARNALAEHWLTACGITLGRQISPTA
jgi:hypothetical protein